MKIQIVQFKGEIPLLGNTKLPAGNASTAINTKVMTGDLAAYYDFGNATQLVKAAPIEQVFNLDGMWLQYSVSENTYGDGIDIAPGTIPGDTTFRTFISGTLDGLRQTNKFYATDPSQQGANAAHAYPYVTFPVGLANPTSAPTSTTSSGPASPPHSYDFIQPAYVENAIVANAGSGYHNGDVLTISGGTLGAALPAATVKILAVTDGAISNTPGSISLLTGGFYTTAPSDSTPAASTGGSGTGATFNLTTSTLTTTGLSLQTPDNGAGAYAHWTANTTNLAAASGQLPTSVAYTTGPFGIKTATAFTQQVDAETLDNGDGAYADIILYAPGSPADSSYGGHYRSLSGGGVVLSKTLGTFSLYSNITGSGNSIDTSNIITQATGLTISAATYYRISMEFTVQNSASSPGFSVVATVALQSSPDTILATVSGFLPYAGEQFGIGIGHVGPANNGNDGAFQNLLITVSQAAIAPTAESTSYVYTYLSEYGTGENIIAQESGPSPPSTTLTIYTDTTTTPPTLTPVSVTIPAVPSGKSITNINLYRLVRQSDGSEQYQFATTLAASTTDPETYTDTTIDTDLGALLATSTYSPPPSNLQGIIALPNGVMAGFFDNTLAMSEPNFPFAWPVNNQYTTDFPIVGIAAIDTTVLIMTTAHPYTAFGSDPGNYTMSKETSVQGCVSKRSIATHKRAGIIYASGNGAVYYKGQGQLDLLRDANDNPYFTYEQWQALVPSSIRAVVHDDYYWWWYNQGTGKKAAGYALDIPLFFGYGGARVGAGFGLIETDFHVTSAYVDPQTDNLYITPDKSVYPIAGSVVSSASNLLSQWEGNPAALREYSWERAEFLMPRDVTFMLAQVQAEDYTDITLKISSEQGVAFNGAVLNSNPFIIAPQPGKRWNIQITGTSVVNVVSMYESSAEISPQ